MPSLASSGNSDTWTSDPSLNTSFPAKMCVDLSKILGSI